MKPTAIFLGHIGKSIGILYAKNKGEGSGSDIRNSKCLNFFKSQTSLNVSTKDLSIYDVKKTISKGFPVIFQILHPYDEDGHCALIDHVVTETREYENFYIPNNPQNGPSIVVLPSSSKDWTLEELQKIYGNEVYKEHITETNTIYKINWGWGDDDNEISINASDYIWKTSDYDYLRSSALMYYIE